MSPFVPFLVLAAGVADAPAQAPVAARVVEGKPLTVTVTGNAEGEDSAPKAITLRVVGGQVLGGTVEVAGAPERKVPFVGVVTTPLSSAVRAQTELGDDIGLFVDALDEQAAGFYLPRKSDERFFQ